MFEYIPKIFQCLSLHFIAETQFRTTAFLLLLKQKKKKNHPKLNTFHHFYSIL